MNCTKLVEHTYGTHTFMRMRVNGRIEEIDVYWRENGPAYHTSADNSPDLPKPEIREMIIDAFNELF